MLRELINSYEKIHGKDFFGDYEGCSMNEIINLETKINGRLPKIYVEFLLIAGKKSIAPLRGDDCTINVLDGYLKEEAIYSLERMKSFFKHSLAFRDNDFVFWGHQSYSFEFFNLSEGDDPPVYAYSEGEIINFEKINNTLTDNFINVIESWVVYYLKSSPPNLARV